MVDKDKLIKEQGEQIEALKKVVSNLHSGLVHLEKRNRSNEAKLYNNARDIRNIAIQLQQTQQQLARFQR